MASVTLTRQQLYDRVWKTPVEALARELGLSGRGLGKLCARLDIPVPPRGYWAKKAAGHRVSQPALPGLERRQAARVEFDAPDSHAADGSKPELHPLVAFEQQPENRLLVPEGTELRDPTVLKAQRMLRKAKRDQSGVTIPVGPLSVRTSRVQHDRALRIVQILMDGLRSRGFELKDTAQGARVVILGEELGFGIEELLDKVAHRTTFTEQKRIDQGFGYGVPKFDRVPSGRLALVITNAREVRQRWAEGSVYLENMLNKFIIGLVRAALWLKRQRADAEQRERERQEAERLRQEEAERQAIAQQRWREEVARSEHLERLSDVWEKNKRLRAVVEHLKVTIGQVGAESEIGKWIAWAVEHADRSDPFRRLQNRKGGRVELYYYGHDRDRVTQDGFTEPSAQPWSNDKVKPGVELTDRPPQVSRYESALKLDLLEDLVLPHEWPQDSDWFWRVFRVPAAVLNRALNLSLTIGA